MGRKKCVETTPDDTTSHEKSKRKGVHADNCSQFSEESNLVMSSLTFEVVVNKHRSKDRKFISLLD